MFGARAALAAASTSRAGAAGDAAAGARAVAAADARETRAALWRHAGLVRDADGPAARWPTTRIRSRGSIARHALAARGEPRRARRARTSRETDPALDRHHSVTRGDGGRARASSAGPEPAANTASSGERAAFA